MMDVDTENDFNREMQAHDAHELADREWKLIDSICFDTSTRVSVLVAISKLRAAGWQITDPITHEEQTLAYAASLDNDPFKD